MIEKLAFGLFSKEDSHSFMRLMDYVRPYKSRIIFALLAIVGVAATESYLAAFIAPLVNFGFAAPRAAPSHEGVQGAGVAKLGGAVGERAGENGNECSCHDGAPRCVQSRVASRFQTMVATHGRVGRQAATRSVLPASLAAPLPGPP